MFNVISSKEPLPNSIEIFTIERKKLDIRLGKLRKTYFELGWNIVIIKDKIGLMAIDKENIDEEPPLLEECWKEESEIMKSMFYLFDSLDSQNQLSHSFFTTLKYNSLKNLGEDKFVIAKDLNLHFKRDLLLKKPVLDTKYYKVYKGLQFVPSLKKENKDLYPLFIVKRVIRVKGQIRGSPRQLQNLSNLNTEVYFNQLNSLLKEFIGNELECNLGNYVFKIKGYTEEFETEFFEISKEDLEMVSEEVEEYNEDDLFLEEIEEEYEDDDELENEEILEEEIIEYVFPRIPKRLEYAIIKSPPLWVGRNEKKSDTTTMHLLNQFGPLESPQYKIVFIPLYPENQRNIKEKLEKVCNLIINGSGTGRFDFPGLKRRFGLNISLGNSKSFPVDLNRENFKRNIHSILLELRNEFSNLPLSFSLSSEIVPIFIVGFREHVFREWGKYTPLYQYFKENLVCLGFPSQMITKFDKFLVGDWISFPLWSIATSIFAKIGGIPWHVDAGLTKKKKAIDAIIGYRFARSFSDEENVFILGIATIFTGNGRYLGFKVGTVNIDDTIDNYNFFFRNHGYTRRYEGLKIHAEDVKTLFNDAVSHIENNILFQDEPGGVIVHRLGSISNEEADSFLECFQLSNFSAGALVSMSEFPLRWKFNNQTVVRGTWININENSGLLFPQGRTTYFQGIKNKNFYPSSVPKSFKVNILRDNGVYNKPYEAAADIMALSRMNWRHVTYIPSIYPISLEYSLIIAQNLKNNIIPTGDLIKLPWFL